MSKIKIESEFTKCVKSLEGQVFDELLKQPQFKNADYWFPKYKTIIELKRLDENLTEKQDFQEKISSLYSSWVQKGLIPRGKMKFNLSSIPEECANEYIKVVKRRIESSILKKANEQIRETKTYLEEPTAKGLLIIANDRNKLLTPEFMAHILHRSLKNQYTNIDSIIYFSANLAVTFSMVKPQIKETYFWIDAILDQREPAAKKLRDELLEAWISNYSELFPEIPIAELLMPNDQAILEEIDFV